MVFVSAHQAVLRQITDSDVTVVAAVRKVIDEEAKLGLLVPELYASTAISSGGHYWNPVHSGSDGKDYAAIIAANNWAAAAVSAAVGREFPSVFEPRNVMLPTELGKVFFNRSTKLAWNDSDYMLFYLCWLFGLSATGTEWVVSEMASPAHRVMLDTMDKRELGHDERWVPYQIFVEILCSKLRIAGSRPDGRRAEPSHTLVQLIDTNHSLGARAEALYARIQGLDVLAPLFQPALHAQLDSEVRAELAKLEALRSPDATPINVGATTTRPVSLVAMYPR